MGIWRKWLGKNTYKTANQPADSQSVPRIISIDLTENHSYLKDVFANCSDISFKAVSIKQQTNGLLVYTEGITDKNILNEQLLRVLFLEFENMNFTADPKMLAYQEIPISGLTLTETHSELISAVLEGSVALLIDGYQQALVADVKGGERRAIQEPVTEGVIRGPREGFTESIQTNMALIRFKLKTPEYKTIAFVIGEKTKTKVILAYIDSVVDPSIIDEVKSRLQRIQIDAILESGYIEEFIVDNPYSLFPQLQYSERPDSVVSQLLEGRFAILTDGTPFVLTGPVTIWQFLQASEDYYEYYFIANLLRWLRIGFVFVTLFLPSLYVAVTTIHQDMLPTPLILSIAAARESIPFPALVEAFIMEVSFEALREAGVRLPRTIGQAVSILGALVIGQSAVQAGIVSAPMVIIVSLTGIASFCIPRYNLSISLRLLRFPMMIMAAVFGLIGMVIGTLFILVHLCQLRSFGIPYLSGLAPFDKQASMDILVRKPWWNMVYRPNFLFSDNRKRMKERTKVSPEPTEKW
ncbi:spore germination protein [Paenibacillus qinlingensis]|uniref:spore germination protein n=1 Tax=Paenibacillus qinlingensis TaxID=1837343 RepID=UPI00156365F1|nr:spore germination protein [Paenibacillus qinlingensis]NQX60575.1 spore germination protein [Paenibacillus qinlingensis]